MTETYLTTKKLLEAAQWLYGKLNEIRGAREKEVAELANSFFVNPGQLAEYYVQPGCQHHNPADERQDDVRAQVSAPAFQTIGNSSGY